MNGGSLENVRVFISYCWNNPKTKLFVENLATRLMADHIDVIIDIWDLSPGKDLNAFIEKSVTDKSITKILVVCDEQYKIKADKRDGGVGAETTLISAEVYAQVDEDKVIPIIIEKDENGKDFKPAYIKSKIHVELIHTSSEYEANYESLIRNIYNKPSKVKPLLGAIPSFVLTDEPKPLIVNHIRSQLENVIINNPSQVNIVLTKYLDVYLKGLNEISPPAEAGKEEDDRITWKIDYSIELAKDFLIMLEILNWNKELFPIKAFINFFQELLNLQYDNYLERNDYYVFINNELILFFSNFLLENELFKEFSYLVNTTFFVENNNGKTYPMAIADFAHYNDTLDGIRNRRLNLNRVSLTADLLMKRAEKLNVQFDRLKGTDLILHYVTACLGNNIWFPRTSVYGSRRSINISILDKIQSKRYFENFKHIFNIDSPNDMNGIISKYNKVIESKGPYNTFDYKIPTLSSILDINSIGTVN